MNVINRLRKRLRKIFKQKNVDISLGSSVCPELTKIDSNNGYYSRHTSDVIYKNLKKGNTGNSVVVYPELTGSKSDMGYYRNHSIESMQKKPKEGNTDDSVVVYPKLMRSDSDSSFQSRHSHEVKRFDSDSSFQSTLSREVIWADPFGSGIFVSVSPLDSMKSPLPGFGKDEIPSADSEKDSDSCCGTLIPRITPDRISSQIILSEHKDTEMLRSDTVSLEDPKAVEQLYQLFLSSGKDNMPSAILDYLQNVGIFSEKAKSVLECLYLHDGSLKHADKVCIGSVDENPAYLALYSNIVPEVVCSILLNTFKVIHRTIGHVSAEAKDVSDMEITQKLEFSETERKRIHACLAKNTTILMKEHSNLMMVSASKLKSVGYGTPDSIMHVKTCIVLYVQVKSFIPFGEKPFPSQVDEFPTDVREGIFKTFSDPRDFHESLVMGCQIVTSYNTCGTLGAFVQLQSGYLGCLTCAHVFETEESLNDYRKGITPLSCFKTEVYQPAPSDEYKVGNVEQFLQESGDECNIGLDAALIVLKAPQRYPRKGTFSVIDDAIRGFSNEKPLVFSSGEIIKCFEDIKPPYRVVKYGATTGFTEGRLRSYGTSVRSTEPSFVPERDAPLHQQLEVLSINGPFAKKGDSGSLVFSVCTVGETTELKALGLLVGGAINKQHVIVTPIWAILNKLQLPLQLFCFDGSHRSDIAFANVNNSLQSLGTDVNDLKEGLSYVNSQLGAISSSMVKKEDFENLIQHIQNLTQTNQK